MPIIHTQYSFYHENAISLRYKYIEIHNVFQIGISLEEWNEFVVKGG